MRNNSRFVVLALAFSAFACGGQKSTPTSPSAPTAPPSPTPTVSFTLSGTIRETSPAPTPALAGSTVTVLDGEHAGKTASTDAAGIYRMPGLSGNVTVRVAKNGYEPETRNLAVNRDMTADFGLGHVWPDLIVSVMLSRLPVEDGLLFKRAPGSGPSYYAGPGRDGSPPVVVYVSPAPFSGEIGAIAHEVCHAHQGRATRDAGLSSYYDTAEGKDFIQTAGWRLENGQWIEKCEPGWCGYRNPLEDSAQTCATYYDPGRSWAPDSLSRMAPIRNAWAMRWLPK